MLGGVTPPALTEVIVFNRETMGSTCDVRLDESLCVDPVNHAVRVIITCVYAAPVCCLDGTNGFYKQRLVSGGCC